jgi:hypothetical protein
MTYSPPPL